MSASPYPLYQTRAAPVVFLLASRLTGYPDRDFIHAVRALLEDCDLELSAGLAEPEGWEAFRQLLLEHTADDGRVDDLCSEYIDLFDRSREANPLYETEYGRDRALGKSAELADLAGFYRAFGFAPDGEGPPEMLDHVSLELEFYALMLLKQAALEELGDEEGGEIVLEGRRRFLRDHLGRFLSAIEGRPAVLASPYYGPVLHWCRTLVDRECRLLEIEPDRVAFIAGQEEAPEIECGVLRGASLAGAASARQP